MQNVEANVSVIVDVRMEDVCLADNCRSAIWVVWRQKYSEHKTATLVNAIIWSQLHVHLCQVILIWEQYSDLFFCKGLEVDVLDLLQDFLVHLACHTGNKSVVVCCKNALAY